jgi:hypothetical protein
MTDTINIYCANVNNRNDTTHALLHKLATATFQFHIVIVTEPWIGIIQTDTLAMGTVRHQAWEILMPTSAAHARVCVYYRKNLPFRIEPDSSFWPLTSFMVPIKIHHGDTTFNIIATYNSPTHFDASNHITNSNPPDAPTLFIGDFNLHAPDWDNTVTNVNPRTQTFVDWLTTHDFRVLNNPDQPTYHGHNFQFQKVDDLAIANTRMLDKLIMDEVIVHTDHSFASDHYPISIILKPLDGQNNNHEPDHRPHRPQEKDKTKWIQNATNTFKDIQNRLPPDPTPQDLDKLTTDIIATAQNATSALQKKNHNNSDYSKHWWNDSIDEALDNMRQHANNLKASRHNPYLKDLHHQAKNVFRARVKHAKREWANKRLEDATPTTVWDFISWYKHNGKRQRPLYKSPAHVPASDNEERANKFYDCFYSTGPPNDLPEPTAEPLPQRTNAELTNDELESAIKSCSNSSAPGPSGIDYRTIKWIQEANPKILHYLYANCIRIGHYPSNLKHSTTVVAPKPNKEDYTVPKAYRPIQLTECLAKVLDKIIARRIQYEVATWDIVPHYQFGGRILSGTIDAGLTLIEEIHKAWDNKKKATALLFDISGFFNHVNHDKLLKQLKLYGFADQIVNLVKGFMSNRSTSLLFDNYNSPTRPLPHGIPQGSPLSPILSIIYTAELQKMRELVLKRIISLAYIDDGILLTSSPSLETNVHRLENAYDVIVGRLTQLGLKVETSKNECMHFTRGPDSSNPPIRLANTTQPITPPKYIRWLGFYLDRHLNFTHHTKIMAARATATIRAMKILGNTVRGMSQDNLRRLTIGTIIPVLTYGCQLWWGNKCTKANTNRLQTALNGAL